MSGYSVLVTRPMHQCDELARRIRQVGGEPLIAPMLGVRAVTEGPKLATALKKLDQYDIAIFVSRNAVEYLFDRLTADGRAFPDIPVYAVGLGTASQLKARGIEKVITPRDTFNSEGLLELTGLAIAKISGRSVVLFCGRGGRELLADVLTTRGANVTVCEVYERFVPDTKLANVVNGQTPDAAVVTSLEGLKNLADKIADESLESLYDMPLFVASERIAEEVPKLGFTSEPQIIDQPGDHRIVSALVEWAGGA
ncbi:MAG: uroporphyrinogen-III synthase [Gammaproteobacteria bacterium]|nr:uroporphyrinogen-III synthase [Gammaproteobacteria bacterium]